jgi:hypothetical protein
VIASDPGREFAFTVAGPGGQTINTWRYQLDPDREGTDVTDSFELSDTLLTRLYWTLAGARVGPPTWPACAPPWTRSGRSPNPRILPASQPDRICSRLSRPRDGHTSYGYAPAVADPRASGDRRASSCGLGRPIQKERPAGWHHLHR